MSFVSSVAVNTYSRSLGGGDGVPTDGSTVALGLGRSLGLTKVRLAGPRAQSDQISWMPPDMREKSLEEAMGADSFARARAQQTPDLAQLLERRESAKQDGKDVMLMPQSLLEAQTRAGQLSAEVKAERAERLKAVALRRLAMPVSPRKKPQGTLGSAARPKAAEAKFFGKTARRMKVKAKRKNAKSSSKVRKNLLKLTRQNLQQFNKTMQPDDFRNRLPKLSAEVTCSTATVC